MKKTALLTALILTVGLLSALFAEKADLDREQLRKVATHIVAGEVQSIFTKTEVDGPWRYTRYLAEVRVEVAEKGDGVKEGDLVYVRYWRRVYLGEEMPPSTLGHRNLPEEGQTLRIYLARNAYDGFVTDNQDGGFNVIGANGFEALIQMDQGEVK
ncbi:MAG: hypothetical protein ACYS47_04010 [Planctomycetota bacterium]|jgi:hypothetical protein